MLSAPARGRLLESTTKLIIRFFSRTSRLSNMILRLSQNLGRKLRVISSECVPLSENPLTDWSAHLFTADRTPYLMVTNTVCLYSAVTYARGAATDSEFIPRVLGSLRETMADDRLEETYLEQIAPSTAVVTFSRALNRSVTGSMNDLAFHARKWLTEGELSPFDTAEKLNKMPMSLLKYQSPREALLAFLQGT